MTKKIIFSAGGTGGHILPAINLMNHFLKKGYKVLIVTDSRGNSFLKNFPELKTYVVRADTPTNKNFFRKIISLLIILYSILKAFLILRKEKADLVFGFGGYVSFPIAFSSKFFKLPLLIYENNMILGRTNKYLAPFSKKILLAKEIEKNFLNKYKSKTHIVGSILNKNIIGKTDLRKSKNKNFFSILVLGGSQGAEIFGKIIPPVIKKIKQEGIRVKINQQCAKGQKNNIENYYKENSIENYIFEFEKDIMKLILETDLAITRCGASATAELAHTFTPFIAVPLKSSIDNHQHLNAKYYENKGCCLLLEQDNFNINSVFNLIMETIKDENKLKMISNNMKKNHGSNAYSNIENQIRELI